MFSHFCTVEELGHTNVLEKAFSPPGLYHELPGELWGLAGLERSQLDRFVQGIAWHYGPVGELRKDKGLAHGVRS